MEGLITLAVVIVLAVYIVGKVVAATRAPDAGKKRDKSSAEAKIPDDAAKRARLEEEVWENLANIRKKRQERVADAVTDDPHRAAKVVRRMMRGKDVK